MRSGFPAHCPEDNSTNQHGFRVKKKLGGKENIYQNIRPMPFSPKIFIETLLSILNSKAKHPSLFS